MSKTTRCQDVSSKAQRVQAQLAVNGQIRAVNWVRDLHREGALLGCAETVPLGTPCQLNLSLDEAVTHRVILLGHVLRAEEGCLLLKLVNVPRSESFSVIRDALLDGEPKAAGTLEVNVSEDMPVPVRQVG